MRRSYLVLTALWSVLVHGELSAQSPVRVRVSSTEAGHALQVLARGGGGTLALRTNSGEVAGDSLVVHTPAEFSFDPMAGEVLFDVVGDSVWLRLELTSARAQAQAEGVRILVRATEDRLEVRGVPPTYQLKRPTPPRPDRFR